MITEHSLLINGKKVAGKGAEFGVINPATGVVFANCPAATPGQLDEAVQAAKKAFQSWRLTSDSHRKNLLIQIAERIKVHADELAELIVIEQGKPLIVAHAEVGGAIAWTEAAAAQDIPVDIIADYEEKRIEAHRKPLGVVASITPWNWPLMIAIWHIMPALRAGNTVICKPSELTPLNTLKLRF